MSTPKTTVNDASVIDFINSVADPVKRNDSLALLDIFTEVTGETPKMWGSSIVGFGSYHYVSDRSSQEGEWPLTGFSPRKQNLTLYFMHGFDKYEELLSDLGKYKTSKSCLYLNKLADIDTKILRTLIELSFKDMKQHYTVQ